MPSKYTSIVLVYLFHMVKIFVIYNKACIVSIQAFIVNICAYYMQVACNNDYSLTNLQALFTVLLSTHLKPRAPEWLPEITQLMSTWAMLHMHSGMLLTLTLYVRCQGGKFLCHIWSLLFWELIIFAEDIFFFSISDHNLYEH